jgi:predicted  nucleic acid-binding Zn-ribbon protein
LEEMLHIERNKNTQATDERDRNIENLRDDLQDLGRNYDELITTKASLNSEISIYRKLLEGEERRYERSMHFIRLRIIYFR